MDRKTTIVLGVGFGLIFVVIAWQLMTRNQRTEMPQRTAQPTTVATQAIPTQDADGPATDDVEITLIEGPTPTRASGTVELASGSFYPVTFDGSGNVSIIELSDGTRYMRFDPFVLQSEADLRVVLVAINPVPSSAIAEIENGYDLGELVTTRGAQTYEIPAEVDLSLFRSVVIWSTSLRKPMMAAPLSPP